MRYTILFLMLTGCMSPEKECGFIKNQSGQNVSWNKQIVLKIDSSIPVKFIPEIEAAAQTWNSKLGKQILVIDKNLTHSNPEKKSDNVNVIYGLEKWDGKIAEQAVTFIYWTGRTINEADIRINLEYFKYYTSSEPREGVNFQALMLHELGHVLGMNHNDIDSSVMNSFLSNSDDRINLTQKDSKNFLCMY